MKVKERTKAWIKVRRNRRRFHKSTKKSFPKPILPLSDKMRKRLGLYKYQCTKCGTIWDLYGAVFLTKDNIYTGGKCKVCVQKEARTELLPCPHCQHVSLYVADWDYLGEENLFVCKHCGIKFQTREFYDCEYLRLTRMLLQSYDKIDRNLEIIVQRKVAQDKKIAKIVEGFNERKNGEVLPGH